MNQTLVATAIGAVLVALVLSRVEVYMDEVFHVPQYQRVFNFLWNRHAWEWDPAITTFPGLYLISGIWPQQLPVYMLRAFNAVLLNVILYHVGDSLGGGKKFTGITIVMYPLNFFYSCLYYTDSAATDFVLLTAALFLERMYMLSGVTAGLAVLVRQTNVVWVFGFCLAETINRWYKSRNLSACIKSVLGDMWLHMVVGIAFVVFVVKFNNFSIVLGHHEFHSLSLHLAQINYLVLTAVASLGPHVWLSTIGHFRECWKSNRLKLCLVFLASAIAAEYGTMAHPFILSDNRHYSFYFFKYFVSRRWIRSLVIPAIVAISICHSPIFNSPNPTLPRWVFWMCTCICLIPTPLLEFRYFNIPVSLLLSSSGLNTRSLWFFMLVNVIVVHIFVFRPFEGVDGSLARFMY